jgi:hypothetical protein
MRKWRGCVAIWGLLLVLPGLGSAAMAQDPAAPEEEPATAEEPASVMEQQDEGEKEKMPFALYVGVAGGMGDADEFNTTIFANELNAGANFLTLDEQTYGRAAIGWKLPHRKGDFRLIFQGVKEEEYSYSSRGLSDQLPGDDSVDIESGGLVPWWFIQIDNGDLVSVRLVPMWDLATDDADGDGKGDFDPSDPLCNLRGDMAQCGEISYDLTSPDRVVLGTMPDNLQNRVNTYDVVYGREFGGRRYSSRWWGGVRYFQYEGQLLASAWLNVTERAGEHFTDGSFLRLLNIAQETSGFGPVGSWEADFNFYDKGLQLFIRGEAAFTFNSMEMDSGPFFQILDEGSTADDEPATTLDDRLVKSLDKSSWQDRAEIGARVNLKNGLQFEVGYSIAGYLDFILMPDLLQLGVTNDDPQTFTQDIVVEAFHVGVGFQF